MKIIIILILIILISGCAEKAVEELKSYTWLVTVISDKEIFAGLKCMLIDFWKIPI